MSSLTGNPFIDIPGVIAGALTAWWVIWRKGIKPMYRTLNKIGEVVPVLTSIAEEFKANGGGSLRDAVDRIDAKADRAAESATRAVEVAQDAVKKAEKTAELIRTQNDFVQIHMMEEAQRSEAGRLAMEDHIQEDRNNFDLVREDIRRLQPAPVKRTRKRTTE